MPGLEDCSYTLLPVQLAEQNVLLVIDKSRSMADMPVGYPMSKWAALHSALADSLVQIQDMLGMGLELFPFTADPADPIPPDCGDRCCEMPPGAEMNVNIGPGFETATAIAGAVNAVTPAGASPTAEALRRAYAYFTSGAGAALGGDRFVVLVTDGGPNCNPNASCTLDTCTLNLDGEEGCATPDTPNALSCCANQATACLDDVQAVGALVSLEEAGIQTVVVAMPGAEPYAPTLVDLALVGGFTPPDGDWGLYQVPAARGVEGLKATLEEVLLELAQPCQIVLGEPLPNPNEVLVVVDCSLLPAGGPGDEGDRWYYDDPAAPSKIIIDGPICQDIRQAGADSIDLVLGCPLVGPH